MANNRVSGRQGVSTGQSGRAPATTGSSARIQPAARQSARVQPQAAAPAPGSSGRLVQQPSASGRSPASASGRAPAPAPAAQSARTRATAPAAKSARGAAQQNDQSGRNAGGKYKKRRGGPEVLIAFGVIGVLGLLALVVYIRQNGKLKEVNNIVSERKAKLEENMKLALDTFERADQVGRLFVIGKEPNAVPDAKELDPAVKTKIFGPFQNDPNVYNVIYDWNYKDRKQKAKTRQEFLFAERNRIERIQSSECDKEENGVRLNYGFADGKTTPIVIATKTIKSQEGDTANTGGMITVIVKAKTDHIFEKAQQAKPKNEPATGGGGAAAPPAGGAEPGK